VPYSTSNASTGISIFFSLSAIEVNHERRNAVPDDLADNTINLKITGKIEDAFEPLVRWHHAGTGEIVQVTA